MTIQKIREQFPLFTYDNSIYLDNAATSQKPSCVLDAEKHYYQQQNANPMRGLYPLSIAATDAYENARETVASFINAASSREVIFTRNTTEALNLVAYSYGLSQVKEGDEIVVSVTEHHSNMLPWQMVAQRTGATIHYLMCEEDGTFSTEELDRVFSPKTRLVAMAQVSNVLGRTNPIAEVRKRVRASGGVLVLDVAQSIPHQPVDVQALDADFVAFSGHKMFASMGIGVLYGKKELLELMPPFLSGGEMIESVTLKGVTYAPVPQKFEAGTVNVGGATSLAAAITFMKEMGFSMMAEREEALTAQLMDGLEKNPYIRVLGSSNPKEHSGIVTFVVQDVHPHDVSEILSADGIDVRAGHHCAQPLLAHLGVRSTTRASMMFYNTEEEIQALLNSLETVRGKLGFGTT